ncbi:MAG: choice-of-anchor tandem repeat GloVer-containing protein [Candidatus Cybelea sp.]
MRTVTLILSGIVLASCSRMTGSSPLPAALPNGASLHPLTGTGYKSLYSFKGGKDGVGPLAGLTAVNGTLYGTTAGGGGKSGDGTVFSITTSGAESVLYSFKGEPDGSYPRADLIALSGALYGTTVAGGESDQHGTVFKVSTSGAEHVLYRFKGGTDGASPQAGLIVVNGTLYGTTEGDGVKSGGTVFKITTSGAEHVLYHFKGGSDGARPFAGLIAVNGTLFGTTLYGGGSGCRHYGVAYGCGTVFKITTSGTESVLYSFKGGKDGCDPVAGLVNVKGTLYGTTANGGTSPCDGSSYGRSGFGTVFKITTSGAEHVLYRFKNSSDSGDNPGAALIAVKGTLYGSTAAGGKNDCSYGGCGTVFAVSTSGKERVLYSFKGVYNGGTDGTYPNARLIVVNGTLYGTTAAGGVYGCEGGVSGVNGCGTVFRISP